MPGGWPLPPLDRSPTRRARRPGQIWPFLPGAVQRPKARPGGSSIGSWVRALVRVGAVATSSTAKGPLNPGLTNDDRNGDCEALRARESPAAPGSSPRSTPHLGRDGRGRGWVDAYQPTHWRGKRAGRRAEHSRRAAKPRSPPSGEAIRAGVEGASRAASNHHSARRWPGEWAGRYRSSQTGPLLRNRKSAIERDARETAPTQERRGPASGDMIKISGLGGNPRSRQYSGARA